MCCFLHSSIASFWLLNHRPAFWWFFSFCLLCFCFFFSPCHYFQVNVTYAHWFAGVHPLLNNYDVAFLSWWPSSRRFFKLILLHLTRPLSCDRFCSHCCQQQQHVHHRIPLRLMLVLQPCHPHPHPHPSCFLGNGPLQSPPSRLSLLLLLHPLLQVLNFRSLLYSFMSDLRLLLWTSWLGLCHHAWFSFFCCLRFFALLIVLRLVFVFVLMIVLVMFFVFLSFVSPSVLFSAILSQSFRESSSSSGSLLPRTPFQTLMYYRVYLIHFFVLRCLSVFAFVSSSVFVCVQCDFVLRVHHRLDVLSCRLDLLLRSAPPLSLFVCLSMCSAILPRSFVEASPSSGSLFNHISSIPDGDVWACLPSFRSLCLSVCVQSYFVSFISGRLRPLRFCLAHLFLFRMVMSYRVYLTHFFAVHCLSRSMAISPPFPLLPHLFPPFLLPFLPLLLFMRLFLPHHHSYRHRHPHFMLLFFLLHFTSCCLTRLHYISFMWCTISKASWPCRHQFPLINLCLLPLFPLPLSLLLPTIPYLPSHLHRLLLPLALLSFLRCCITGSRHLKILFTVPFFNSFCGFAMKSLAFFIFLLRCFSIRFLYSFKFLFSFTIFHFRSLPFLSFPFLCFRFLSVSFLFFSLLLGDLLASHLLEWIVTSLIKFLSFPFSFVLLLSASWSYIEWTSFKHPQRHFTSSTRSPCCVSFFIAIHFFLFIIIIFIYCFSIIASWASCISSLAIRVPSFHTGHDRVATTWPVYFIFHISLSHEPHTVSLRRHCVTSCWAGSCAADRSLSVSNYSSCG